MMLWITKYCYYAASSEEQRMCMVAILFAGQLQALATDYFLSLHILRFCTLQKLDTSLNDTSLNEAPPP